jgi:hypothetical protein
MDGRRCERVVGGKRLTHRTASPSCPSDITQTDRGGRLTARRGGGSLHGAVVCLSEVLWFAARYRASPARRRMRSPRRIAEMVSIRRRAGGPWCPSRSAGGLRGGRPFVYAICTATDGSQSHGRSAERWTACGAVGGLRSDARVGGLWSDEARRATERSAARGATRASAACGATRASPPFASVQESASSTVSRGPFGRQSRAGP